MALIRDASRFRHPGADRGGPVDLAAMRRILVVRPDNVGDVVLLTPALRALRAAAPGARLDLLTSPAGTAVVPMILEVDGVLTASPSWQQLGPGTDPRADAASERALLDRVAAGRYDAMLVFTSFSQSPWPAAYLGLLAGVPTRVVHSREFGGAVATHWVTPPPDTTHHVDRSLHLVAALGVPDRGRTPTLRVPVAAYAQADALLDRALLDRALPDAVPGLRRARFALLVPGASCPSRRYPAARFGAAAAAVAAAGLPVLVAGTAGEAGLVDEVVRTAALARVPAVREARRGTAGGRGDGVRALPAVDLPVFTALVARAAVALTNNSGGLHLADAVGTPVVVTYAGTERLGDVAPRAVPSELLQVPVACSPCRQLVCPFHLECLDLAPERVAAAVLRLAAGRPARPVPPGDPAPDVPELDATEPHATGPDVPASGRPEEDRWPHDPTPRSA